MRTHKSADLMNEYCDSIQHLYPHLSREQLKEVAMHPWRELNRKMKLPDLPPIRLKYFGQFIVKEGRVRYLLSQVKAKYDRGRILERVYLEQVETYTTYLKMKYEDLLKQFGFKEFEGIFWATPEPLRYYGKDGCQVTVNTTTNKFTVSASNQYPHPTKLYWFNSYDLLKEILKKV